MHQKVLSKLLTLILLSCVQHQLSTMTMNSESDSFHQQIVKVVLETLDKSLVNAVTAISVRQDRFEETSFCRLNTLKDQISGLADLMLSKSDTRSTQNEEDHENISHPNGPAAPPSSPVLSPFRALSVSPSSPALPVLTHPRAIHLSLPCNLCDKILRSVPDFNLHHHRYHGSSRQDNSVDLDPSHGSHSSHSPRGPVLHEPNEPEHTRIEAAAGTHVQDDQGGYSSENNNIITHQGHKQHSEATSLIELESATNLYSCALCDTKYLTHNLLDFHLENDHAILNTASCWKCDNIFLNKEELNLHDDMIHKVSSTLFSTTYANPFHSFETREDNAHHNADIHCSFCDSTFLSMPALNVHTATYHGEHLSLAHFTPYCDLRGSVSQFNTNIENHLHTHHTPCSFCDETDVTDEQVTPKHIYHDEPQPALSSSHPGLMFSPIGQLDGNDTLSDVTESVQASGSKHFPSIQTRQTYFAKFPLTPVPAPTVTDPQVDQIKTAPYILNKDKQIQGLGKNASAQDFTINVTSKTEAGIHCSTGFYEAVVKPALSGIGEGFADIIEGVPFRCIGSTIKRDQLGRNVNYLLRFKSGPEDQTYNTTVHLHHSQQHVQVQGGATIWFLDHFLKELFTKGSKAKHFDIKQLNILVSAAAARHQNPDLLTQGCAKYCSHCSKQFRTTSKPSLCGNCFGSYHNAKNNRCFILHSCSAVTPLSSVSDFSITTGTTSTNSVSSLRAPSPSAPSRQSLVFPAQSLARSTIPPSPSTALAGPHIAATSSSSITPPFLSNQAQMNPSTSSFTPKTTLVSAPSTSVGPTPSPSSSPSTLVSAFTTSSSQSIPHPPLNPSVSSFSPATEQNTKKKKKGATAASHEETEIAFLKVELNKARTKILLLDSEIKELEQRNSIQHSKIDILERRHTENLHQQTNSNSTPSPPPTSPPEQTPSPHSRPQAPPPSTACPPHQWLGHSCPLSGHSFHGCICTRPCSMAFACHRHATADTGDMSVKNQLENLTTAVNLVVNHVLSTATSDAAAASPSPTVTVPPPAPPESVPPSTSGPRVSYPQTHIPPNTDSPTPSFPEQNSPTPMSTGPVPPSYTVQAEEAETLEDSIATVEMFDFDNQAEDEESDCLNSQEQTTQL